MYICSHTHTHTLITQLPHLYATNHQSSFFRRTPRGIPRCLRIHELFHGEIPSVVDVPGEESIDRVEVAESPDGEVDDQVEFLIKWGVLGGRDPGIGKSVALVETDGAKLAKLPEPLCRELEVRHAREFLVDVGPDGVGGPFHAKGVKVRGQGARAGGKGEPVGGETRLVDDVGRVGAPVQGTHHGVVSAGRQCAERVDRHESRCVAARFRNVHLSRLGPETVRVLGRQHPDGRPDPVTDGHLGGDFHTTVLDRHGIPRADPR